MDLKANRFITTHSRTGHHDYTKWAFWIMVLLGFVGLPILSLDAGISGDEHLHYQQSLRVLEYYKSMGADQSALDTPGTHLKYYGQVFDNLITLATHLFGIEDIYTARHMANAWAGWLAILISGLLARSLYGYRTATIAVLLLFISPRFIGHSFNNLKDIPFALGYIASLYFIFDFIREWPAPKKKTIALLILSIGFILGVRIGGIMVYGYFLLFLVFSVLRHHPEMTMPDARQMIRMGFIMIMILILSWVLGLFFWPYGLEHPIRNPARAFQAMSQFPTTIRQIFEGRFIWSDALPWYYLLKYMVLTIPLIVLFGWPMYLFSIRHGGTRWSGLFSLYLLFSIVFPLAFIILNDSNTYGAWRHVLFVYPPMVILAARGLVYGMERLKRRWLQHALLVIFCIGCLGPVRFMVRNHPYQYLYYNEFIAGLDGAYTRYETDYYFHGMREGCEWLIGYDAALSRKKDTLIIASNFPVQWWFRMERPVIQNIPVHYYTRGNSNWDYAIIGNSYIHPFHLSSGAFPPGNSIHTVRVDSVPICAVLKREHSDDAAAYRALHNNRYEKAIQLSRKAIAAEPKIVSNYITLSKAYRSLNRHDSAIIALENALLHYPQYELVYDMMGRNYVMMDSTARATKCFKKALDINHKYFPAYVHLAELLISEGQETEGVALLKKCLTLNPQYKPAYIVLGEYFLSTGQNDVGRKYLDHAEKLK